MLIRWIDEMMIRLKPLPVIILLGILLWQSHAALTVGTIDNLELQVNTTNMTLHSPKAVYQFGGGLATSSLQTTLSVSEVNGRNPRANFSVSSSAGNNLNIIRADVDSKYREVCEVSKTENSVIIDTEGRCQVWVMMSPNTMPPQGEYSVDFHETDYRGNLSLSIISGDNYRCSGECIAPQHNSVELDKRRLINFSNVDSGEINRKVGATLTSETEKSITTELYYSVGPASFFWFELFFTPLVILVTLYADKVLNIFGKENVESVETEDNAES